MDKDFETLASNGFFGSTLYWSRLSLYLVSISYIIFMIYWCAKVANSIWLNAVGGSHVATTAFSILSSLISFILLLFNHLRIVKSINEKFLHHVMVISYIITVCISIILLSLSTQTKANIHILDIQDYIARNQNISTSLTTNWSIQTFVNQRTIYAYNINSVFLVLFMIILFLFEVCFYLLGYDIKFVPDFFNSMPIPNIVTDNKNNNNNRQNQNKDVIGFGINNDKEESKPHILGSTDTQQLPSTENNIIIENKDNISTNKDDQNDTGKQEPVENKQTPAQQARNNSEGYYYYSNEIQ